MELLEYVLTSNHLIQMFREKCIPYLLLMRHLLIYLVKLYSLNLMQTLDSGRLLSQPCQNFWQLSWLTVVDIASSICHWAYTVPWNIFRRESGKILTGIQGVLCHIGDVLIYLAKIFRSMTQDWNKYFSKSKLLVPHWIKGSTPAYEDQMYRAFTNQLQKMYWWTYKSPS